MKIFPLLIGCLFLGFASCDCMQGSEGVVMDNTTKLPLENVRICNCIKGDGNNSCRETFTDEHGKYDFSHISGGLGKCPDLTLYFEKSGYHSALRKFEQRSYGDTIFLEKADLVATQINVATELEQNNTWLLTQRLPQGALKQFKNLLLDKEYSISAYINPFYLQADFNGDSQPDVAVAVEKVTSKKKGIVILHGSNAGYAVIGAGTSFGSGGDNFDWMDIWHTYSDSELEELTFSKDSEVDGTHKLKLNSTAIAVEKSESAGGVIYWNGKEYKWAQTSD